ncbi:Pol polyprotein [Plakobranchus ocellatus]|uniref:Pol polyprotein n=1 Tax=Plakobranchus ocellatus TaxID=259542 RepID=A0AAV3Z3M8_9GAST|nr:Pol polyprotein [Plakobranchus ocellatus]
MADDVQKYCNQCHRCQIAKKPGIGVHQIQGHLLATAPLEIVAIDFTKLEPASDVDVYLGRTPAEAGFTSTGDYLVRHLRRLGEIHQLAGERTKRAAQQREIPMPRGATQLKAGDLVLAKRHLPGTVKTQDVAPMDLPQKSGHKQVNDTDTSSQPRPIPAPRKSSSSAKPPNKLDL